MYNKQVTNLTIFVYRLGYICTKNILRTNKGNIVKRIAIIINRLSEKKSPGYQLKPRETHQL